MIHQAVLPEAVQTYLAPQKEQLIIDATLGAGGHTAALLAAGAHVIAFDRDASAIAAAKQRFTSELSANQLRLVHAPFSQLPAELTHMGQEPGTIDGILIDAGVSSDQLLSQERGFSFASSAPLDMRMDPRDSLTAGKILAAYSQADLEKLFRQVEERSAAKIARAIVQERATTPIQRTDQLADLVMRVTGASSGQHTRTGQHGRTSRGRVHPATKVFLALRMTVNRELEELQVGLTAGVQALKSGGRLVVISFQSLEDRLVKNQMREWTRGCICPPELPVCQCGHTPLVKLLTKKPVTPTPHERATNPRARSAKLRACQKL